MDLTPEIIYKKYQKCVDYNTSIDLYSITENNENYYAGEQWKRCNTPDLQKITMNFIYRVITYFISIITADNVGCNIEMYKESEENKQIASIITAEVNKVMENTNFKDILRNSTRDCGVDGDSGLWSFFNPDIKIKGQLAEGEIDLESLKNTTIYFENPIKNDVQKQPGIIISIRQTVDKVKEEAKANGCDPDAIRPDTDSNQYHSEYEPDGYVTKIIYLTKKKGTIQCSISTQDAWVREPWDTKYSRYHVSYWSWIKIPNSYHGVSPVTNVIPNQDTVNKLYSMHFHSVKNTSFPKILYDGTKLTSGYNNDVGKAIKVNGDPRDAIFNVFNGTVVKNEILDCADRIMSNSKELMGANDAALGEIKPDNTSAIVAATKGSTQPLQLQQKAYYVFVEETLRNWLDIIATDYGTREVKITDKDGNTQFINFDFSTLKDINFKLSIEIGAAAWWNELVQIQTLDNLYAKQIITDKILYLESIPDGYIRNKSDIIEALKKQQAMLDQQNAQLQQMQQQQQQGQTQQVNQQKMGEVEQAKKFLETLPPAVQKKIAGMGPQSLPFTLKLMQMHQDELAKAITEFMKGR